MMQILKQTQRDITLFLVSPKMEYIQLWHKIISEFDNADEKIVPYALSLSCNEYNEFLQKTNDFSNGIIPPDLSHLVKATTYFLMNELEDKILGAVNIRHYLNDNLLKTGGHIGYGIAPSERRNGYAVKMLSLALLKCHGFGIEKALVTCDKSNIGSSKTILKNGGVFENEIIEDNGNVVQRYWIDCPSKSESKV